MTADFHPEYDDGEAMDSEDDVIDQVMAHKETEHSLEHWDLETVDLEATCPLDGSAGDALGYLGSKAWYRCTACGVDFWIPAVEVVKLDA